MTSGREAAGAARSERRWTALLVALALTLPVGALLQPWLLPWRSELPIIRQGIHAPVILITVPGLRADRVHHLGYARETTPRIDELARQGVSFTKAYSTSNDGHASLASLHGGLSPALGGVWSHRDALPMAALTLAERVKRHGYHTIMVRADPAQAGMALEQGFTVREELPAGSPADALLARGLELLAAAPDPNVFLWIDLPGLDAPYGHDGLDTTRFAADMPRGFGERAAHVAPDVVAARGWGERELGWLSDRFDAALFELDAAVGRFLDGLADDMRLETLSLCLAGTRGARIADRPGAIATHGVDLYEPSVHVPLLFRFPQRAIRARRLPDFAQTVDLGPTLLQLALKSGPRAEWPESCGRSLVSTITNRQQLHLAAVVQGLHATTRDELAGAAPRRFQAVRADRYKLIAPLQIDDPGAVELYDLDADPDERRRAPAEAHARALTQGLLRHARPWLEGCGER